MKLRLKLRQLAASISLATAGAIAFSAAPALAFSFQTNVTKALSGADAAKGDIFIDSVVLDSGEVISDFITVNNVNVLETDPFTGGNTGAASADIGDLATTGAAQEDLTDAGAISVLNDLNLNNIIDTEDAGSFVLDLKFARTANRIFLFERGMNSRLDVQALDENGNTIGNLIQVDSKDWDYAGFDIDTKEIGSAQMVGSLGINLMDLGLSKGTVSGLRVSSKSDYNGPDFKFFGSAVATAERVPEPSALLGLGVAVVGLISVGRRKQNKTA